MIATIVKILDPAVSSMGNTYIRVILKSEDGKWIKTDLVPGYKNYERWKKVLQVQNKLYGIVMIDDVFVNADSRVQLLDAKLKREIKKKEKRAKLYAEAARLEKEDPEAYFRKYLC
jgi:hypothetical protein